MERLKTARRLSRSCAMVRCAGHVTAFVPGAAGCSGVERRAGLAVIGHQWAASLDCEQTCVSSAERGSISRRGYAKDSPFFLPPSLPLCLLCICVYLSLFLPPLLFYPSLAIAICHFVSRRVSRVSSTR